MNNDTLENIEKEVLRLYDDGKDIQDIAASVSVPGYLVESILVEKRNVYFR